MVLNDENLTHLANGIGMCRQTLSLKIDGISDFKLSEIKKICDRYQLTNDEIINVFFGG